MQIRRTILISQIFSNIYYRGEFLNGPKAYKILSFVLYLAIGKKVDQKLNKVNAALHSNLFVSYTFENAVTATSLVLV